MLTRIAWSLAILTATTLALASPAAAQLEKAGVVTTLQGTATVARAGRPDLAPLKFKDEVFLRDRITTGDNSVARILLGGKAIVTVRERSVLTITEAPGTATVEMGLGRMALAVIKERMKPGESIEIRTPNAIAGIRGTVVIAEVDEATAQVGGATRGFTTTFTFTRGSGQVNYLDANRRPGAAWTTLTAGQQSRVLGATPPRPPVTLSPGALQQLSTTFQPSVKEAPPATNVPLVSTQMSQGVAEVERYVSRSGPGVTTPGVQPTGGSQPVTSDSPTTGPSSTPPLGPTPPASTIGTAPSPTPVTTPASTSTPGPTVKAPATTPTPTTTSTPTSGAKTQTTTTPAPSAPVVKIATPPPPPPPPAPVRQAVVKAPPPVPKATQTQRIVESLREQENKKKK